MKPLRWLGAAAAAYACYVGWTWVRYGTCTRGESALLDRFMPHPEVSERHQVRVPAVPSVALERAAAVDLVRLPVARTLFSARARILGARHQETPRQQGLVEQCLGMGWGLLAEVPGHEIVLGAVTRPWEANVVFRAVPPEAFAAFAEPDYVKIVRNLRADALTETTSLLRTETRVTTTDARARARFRIYWAFFSPGIALIRRVLLTTVRRTL